MVAALLDVSAATTGLQGHRHDHLLWLLCLTAPGNPFIGRSSRSG